MQQRGIEHLVRTIEGDVKALAVMEKALQAPAPRRP
jgi:hypothetical protein